MTLRLSLLFKEVRDRIGSTVHVRIGNVVLQRPRLRLSATGSAIMEALREMTYALGAA